MNSEIFYHLLGDTRGKDAKYLHLLYFALSGHLYAQKCVVACWCQNFVSNSPPLRRDAISTASVDFESSFSSVNIALFSLLTLYLWNYTNGPVLYSPHQSCKNYWWSCGTAGYYQDFLWLHGGDDCSLSSLNYPEFPPHVQLSLPPLCMLLLCPELTFL